MFGGGGPDSNLEISGELKTSKSLITHYNLSTLSSIGYRNTVLSLLGNVYTYVTIIHNLFIAFLRRIISCFLSYRSSLLYLLIIYHCIINYRLPRQNYKTFKAELKVTTITILSKITYTVCENKTMINYSANFMNISNCTSLYKVITNHRYIHRCEYVNKLNYYKIILDSSPCGDILRVIFLFYMYIVVNFLPLLSYELRLPNG